MSLIFDLVEYQIRCPTGYKKKGWILPTDIRCIPNKLTLTFLLPGPYCFFLFVPSNTDPVPGKKKFFDVYSDLKNCKCTCKLHTGTGSGTNTLGIFSYFTVIQWIPIKKIVKKGFFYFDSKI
jgi:hypothetical protein